MRRTTTRSRARRQSAVGMSLFPFLVVLICTMGSLILLLVILARQARLQAAEDTAQQTAKVRKEIDAAREWAQLEIDEYQHARKKTEAQLADARLALGHIEDHARRLRQQLAQLEATWDELKAGETQGAGRSKELESEITRVRGEIARAERELAEARAAAQRRGSYAVVPYEGPNATRRRPIYIECRRDAVVLQPEKILLRAEDFNGPLGPGNPLDVALRAIRESYQRRRQIDPEAGEPYPLLLVRPDGIEAYYAARDAMKSWADDFGYELIGDDWELAFPPPDPQLAQEVQQAVATARVRQEQLLAAAPGRFVGKAPAGFVASAYRGGLVPRGGSGEASSGYRPHESAGRVGSQYGSENEGGGPSASARPGGSSALGRPGAPGGSSPPTGGPTRSSNGDATQGDQTLSTVQPGGTPSGSSPANGASLKGATCAMGPAGEQPESLAKVRGRNWALPNTVDGWVAVTAPIRIDCHPDSLVLVPEPRLGRTKQIPLGPRTEDSVDELISAVWQYVERWGSAGNGMYWRPVLSMHVTPGGEARYQDLRGLLFGSGLGVERNGD